jgi:hypothetical protein
MDASRDHCVLAEVTRSDDVFPLVRESSTESAGKGLDDAHAESLLSGDHSC